MADLNQGASIEAEHLIEAVRKLVKAKGRFHTEQNYKALADALDSYDAARRTPADAVGAGDLPPIEYDKDMDRTYIPLPGGWEIQTKGKGSTLRIAHVPSKTRWMVLEDDLHEVLEAMARDTHAADRAQRKQADGAVTDYGTPAEPTSAQPAGDDRPTWEMVQARERDIRALQSKVIELEAGAQPDQRESASKPTNNGN
jgi:hypothetical protein